MCRTTRSPPWPISRSVRPLPCSACLSRSCTPGACPEGSSERVPIWAEKRASEGHRGSVHKEQLSDRRKSPSISLAEGIDATTPAGKLQMHILGAIAEFERERIRERVLAGLQRARTQGTRLGRPLARPPIDRLQRVVGLTVPVAAERLGVSRSTIKRWRRQI